MADGDYERGRSREISALAARLRSLKTMRTRAAEHPSRVWVLNGWAASPAAWSYCTFPRERMFSYTDQLAGAPERAFAETADDPVTLVGWSMGGSSALRLACRYPARIRALVLVAATPRMMEDRAAGWRGMSPRRLEALGYGLRITHGEGFFGVPGGGVNPYMADSDENLAAGLRYLEETDIRADVEAAKLTCPVFVFQSERDGIVRPENAAWLKTVFPQAEVAMVPGSEHALPVTIPERIDAALRALF